MTRSLTTTALTLLTTTTIAAAGTSGCPWDLTGDGDVGPADLAQILDSWGPNPGSPADLNGDGVVGPADLAQILDNWGPCPITFVCPGDNEDLYRTDGGIVITFGNDMPPIPPNFFFPGSQPFVGPIDFGSTPIDPDLFGDADTIVRRGGPVCFPGAGFPRPAEPVAIELIELSLTSVQPVIVGGEPWIVSMGLGDNQQPGVLDAQLISPQGGNFVAQLPIKPLLIFAREGELAAVQNGDLDAEDVDLRVLDWDFANLPPLQLHFDAPFSTSPPVDGSFVCPSQCDEFPFFPGVDPNAQQCAGPLAFGSDGLQAQLTCAGGLAPGAKSCIYGRYAVRALNCDQCDDTVVPLVVRGLACNDTSDCHWVVTRSFVCPVGNGRCIGYYFNTGCN